MFVLFAFVFMGWSLLPNAMRPFKIYCAPPNLDITRTWICWLKFSDLRLLTSLKSQTRDPQFKSLPEDLCPGFLRPEKIHRPQPVWTREPWISRRARYPEADKRLIERKLRKRITLYYWFLHVYGRKVKPTKRRKTRKMLYTLICFNLHWNSTTICLTLCRNDAVFVHIS